MTTVALTCPACRTKGTHDGRAVALIRCDHGTRIVWPCPPCAAYVWIPATPQHIALLGSAGIAPLTIAVESGTGPALTEDDLIALRLELEATP